MINQECELKTERKKPIRLDQAIIDVWDNEYDECWNDCRAKGYNPGKVSIL